jgi:hypothetical protein
MKKATKALEPTSNEVVKTKKKMGRPSIFTEEIQSEILTQIAEGKSIRTICKQDGMPVMSTIFYWLNENENFSEQYARAKRESADALVEDIIQMGDDILAGKYDPNAARVALDAKKWVASKLKPKVYGDKLDLTTDGKEMPAPIIAINALPDTTKENKREIIDAEVPENTALNQPTPNTNIMNDINENKT